MKLIKQECQISKWFQEGRTLLSEISMSFLLSIQQEKNLSVKIPNGRIILQHATQNQGSVDP